MRHSMLFAALCAVALSCGLVAESRAAGAGEWQIKSAFIYNFTKFVEWPEAALGAATRPVVIGVLGEQELVADLAALVAGRNVNGRSIEVRTVRTLAEALASQLLFVSAAEESQYAAMRGELADSPVLTVGESPSFSVTGAIGFVQEGEKVRFEINVDIAERSHLKISSQLQKLAIAVRRTR
jgi:YfiR/HmsC-like